MTQRKETAPKTTETKTTETSAARDRDALSHPGQGVVRDEMGQEQPADKERARHVARENKGNDPPGQRRVRGSH
jgi:hypothetical protein